jgi:ferredoxin--NADP+ reductase
VSRRGGASHVVAIFGGACSGSIAAEFLAERSVQVVVYEQNARPYGKIEDGLPRWHREQRRLEYRKIDTRLDREGVWFVPRTRLGADLAFLDVTKWGWSAVLLANGAWKDRPLDVAGAEEYVGRGLVYQNPFVYWFNHKNEAGYDGPVFEVAPGTICVGGGLASIDVIKIIQLELYGRALAERGIDVSMYDLEHKGIPEICRAHGVGDPRSLGVEDGWLVYRRRIEDMPLTTVPDNATPAQIEKAGVVRRRILEKAQEKYLFNVRPLALPCGFIVDGDALAGLQLCETRVEQGRVETLPDRTFELRSRLVISSIGSVPEPIPGVVMKGPYYAYSNWETGEYSAVPGVFGLGNVVTGRGNIKASQDHGKHVAQHLIEHYLGTSDGDVRSISELTAAAEARGEAAARAVADRLNGVPPLASGEVDRLLDRAEARQREVGYNGYRAWLERVTPPDLE